MKYSSLISINLSVNNPEISYINASCTSGFAQCNLCHLGKKVNKLRVFESNGSEHAPGAESTSTMRPNRGNIGSNQKPADCLCQASQHRPRAPADKQQPIPYARGENN